MLDKLEAVEARYVELENMISDPGIISRQDEWIKLTKEHSSLADIVTTFRDYKDALRQITDNKELLSDAAGDEDMEELIKSELTVLEEKKLDLEQSLKVMLLPKDPNDDKNVIMEIRAGTGGDEAALFAGDLFRMYGRFAEKNRWKLEILSSNPTELGGFKEVILEIAGIGVYGHLKYESGVHRVQRVPATEAGGRIHTSAATVAVLAEAEDVDLEINPSDLRIDIYRASGHGGQGVNTTDSAVRITHVPTGIVAQCQDERSQLKNRDKAMKVLRARLLEKAQDEHDQEIAQSRRSQVGSGDRSERIRTYNFPQGRVTDHRIGLTLHQLAAVLEGEIEELITALIQEDQARKLSNAD